MFLFAEFSNLANTFCRFGQNFGRPFGSMDARCAAKDWFQSQLPFQTTFCQQFSNKYLARFQKDDYFENVFYFSALIKSSNIDSAIKEAKELSEILLSALDPYDPTLLTVYQNQQGVMFSEVYEFISRLVNGCHERVPLSNVDAYQTIGNADLHFGTDIAEIRPKNGQKRQFSIHYDLKDFGLSKPKIFTSILTLPCAFTLTQSLIYVNSYKNAARDTSPFG